LVDDLDGSTETVSTVQFGLDGTSYEIDLSPANVARLREALAPYAKAGRRLGRTTGTSRRTQLGPSAAEIKDWARSTGYEGRIPERGRLPKELVDAFEAAH
jgi:hypothetical protein